MEQSWGALIRWWVETRGRLRRADYVEFPEDQIILPRYDFTVSGFTGAVFLNLPSYVYAVITTPNGENQIVKGGYNELAPGRYQLQYIDRQDRTAVLPGITETTRDGAKVSLVVYIRYRATNPLTILEIQKPLPTLFAIVETDIREYCRSRNHDEIVNMQPGVASGDLAQSISQGYNHHPVISRAISLIDFGIKERQGDPGLVELRKTINVQQKQGQIDRELQNQKQELERKVAEQEDYINQLKADSEARMAEIREKMRRGEIELDDARKFLQRKHERNLKALEAVSNALASPSNPRNPNEMKIIENLVAALKDDETMLAPHGYTQAAAKTNEVEEQEHNHHPAPSGEADKNARKIDDLTSTLLNLLKPGGSNLS